MEQHRESDPDPDPVHRGEEGLVERDEHVHEAAERVLGISRRRRHLAEILPGGESVAGAGHHDYAGARLVK